MKQTERKTFYEAPQITVVQFKAERGFAMSNTIGLGLANSAAGDGKLESREDAGSWGGGGSNTWF